MCSFLSSHISFRRGLDSKIPESGGLDSRTKGASSSWAYNAEVDTEAENSSSNSEGNSSYSALNPSCREAGHKHYTMGKDKEQLRCTGKIAAIGVYLGCQTPGIIFFTPTCLQMGMQQIEAQGSARDSINK